MDELAAIGKKRTILLSISIILVSLTTIYFYHNGFAEVDPDKLKQQLFRLALTLILLYFLYNGKQWAITVFKVLFSVGIVFAFIGIFSSRVNGITMIQLSVMAFVYIVSLIHFGFSKSYRAYCEYINKS